MAASLAINQVVENTDTTSDEDSTSPYSMDEKDATSSPLLREGLTRIPQDKFKLVYWIMLLMGVGSLLPWNMFITASSYFSTKFHGSFQNFESYFAVASFIPNVLTTFANIFLQSKISIKIRITGSFIGMFIMMLVTTALTFVDTSQWVNGFFVFTIVSICILNVLAAINQSGLFGMAGLFPGQYTAAFMAGQGVAGIFASVARIIAIGAGSQASQGTSEEEKEDLTSLMYFISACIILLICILASFMLFRLPYFLHFERNSSSKAQQDGNSKTKTKIPYFTVLKKVLPYGLSVFLSFLVTLGLFPGTIALIRSTYNHRCSPEEGCELDSQLMWTGGLFTPLVCFLLFNSSDFVGRTLSNWYSQPKHWIPLLLSASLRLIFFPLFALCFIPGTWYAPVFTYDAIPVILCVVFGISNGYIASISMVHAPSRVPIKYSETASVIAGSFLTLGLACGAAVSVVFVKIIRKSEYS